MKRGETMDCIYTVQNWTSNEAGRSYRERESKSGEVRPFYPNGKAYVTYRVRERQPSGFYCEFEVSNDIGEMVALDRWATLHEHKDAAVIATLQAAEVKAGEAVAMIGSKTLADEVERIGKRHQAELKRIADEAKAE